MLFVTPYATSTVNKDILHCSTKFTGFVTFKNNIASCKLCNKQFINNKRTIGGHFGFFHKSIVKKLKKDIIFSIECFECKNLVANSNNVLSRHLRVKHNKTFEEYEIKWMHNNKHPRCKTCFIKLPRKKGGFKTFCSISCGATKENNSMWNKKGKNSPNFGKKRTIEQKAKYRQGMLQAYKENPKLLQQRRIETIKRIQQGSFNRGKTFTRVSLSTGKKEIFDSQWEYIFTKKYENSTISITKNHSIQIEYFSSDKKRKHIYIPDFVSSNKEIIEIKGMFRQKTFDKIKAANIWSLQNGYKYKIFTYINKKFIELDPIKLALYSQIEKNIDIKAFNRVLCIRRFQK